jgi:hypothetical protein
MQNSSSKVTIVSKKKVRKKVSLDSNKESLIIKYIEDFKSHGYLVRREELKRGLGWKAHNGSCRLELDKIIFVDRRSSQDEQIDFLKLELKRLAELTSNVA